MILRACLAAALALTGAAARAHSEKEIVTPGEDETVSGSPPVIRMVFDEAMRITQIRLSDQGGKSHALRRTDRMQPVTDFAAQPQELPPGAYTVEWRGIALDGHTMDGRWSFTVR
jgi:methionine-rich copper-binding protein CopC